MTTPITSDEKAELRKAAEVCPRYSRGICHGCGEYLHKCACDDSSLQFRDMATPDRVIALLDENARLATERDEARDWVRRITANERLLTCIYCGQSYPPGTPTHNAELLEEHVNACAEHPVAKLRAENSRLAAELADWLLVRDEAVVQGRLAVIKYVADRRKNGVEL